VETAALAGVAPARRQSHGRLRMAGARRSIVLECAACG
jgi:hypothetical protein